MFEQLGGLAKEYDFVLASLSDPEVIADNRRLRELSRRLHELEPVVVAYRRLSGFTADLEVAKGLLAESEGDDRQVWRDEVASAEAQIDEIEDRLRTLLLPKDPNDGRNVIVEIRGTEGGEEANLWARDLHDMYVRYAERLGLRVERLGADVSDMGGFSQVSFLVKGDAAWSHLKYEGGVHRVQRVPVTEAQGRIHTSAAAVTVLPEAEEVEVHIDVVKDLKIDVYRSTGPGGQSVNTTDSAVRITHLPSGIVVAMQDEKSQIQNRAKAMLVLRSRLLRAEQDRQASELSDARRSQVGAGGRSDKIRTYNYKENRVNEHRIGLTLYKLDRILQGELDEIVEALLADERGRQLGESDF